VLVAVIANRHSKKNKSKSQNGVNFKENSITNNIGSGRIKNSVVPGTEFILQKSMALAPLGWIVALTGQRNSGKEEHKMNRKPANRELQDLRGKLNRGRTEFPNDAGQGRTGNERRAGHQND
jgi:hypothetical protein